MNNIQLNIVANAQFQQVYAEVAKLKEAMLSLQKASVGGPFTAANVAGIKQAQQAFDNAVLSTRAFNVEHVAMTSNVEKFGKQLKAGQLSLSNYYKIWRDSTKGVSKELDSLATTQARLNRSIAIADPLRPGYAKLVTDINGLVTKQEKAIFYQKALNTAMQQGSIKLIDFGKNTQWMGRQLTVGLTMPMAMFGAAVANSFKQVDQELTRMQKVYGTGLIQPTQEQLKMVRDQVTLLGKDLAKTLGTSMQETASMAADLAATGLQGSKLIGATREAIRLATLGELDHQQAMQATISLQNVYKLSTNGLKDAVNFLNAVENQTSTSLQDLVDAIPRVGPIVQQLGGSFKDTAAMMVAMKEAGVPAAQGANAIKSALSSLINPTTAAQKAFAAYNINIAGIAKATGGAPIAMLKMLSDQMKGLSRLAQAQLIEKLFGKFQYARIQALLDNINKSGTQTATVFNLMGASTASLAQLATNELKQQTESASGRFKRMTETLKADLIPIGKGFLNSFTTIGNVVDKIVTSFQKVAKVLGPFGTILGKLGGLGLGGLIIVGPIIMLVGLFANLIGNILRGANAMRMFKQGLEAATPEENRFLAGLHAMRNFYEDLDKSTIAARNQMELMPEAITSNAMAFDILNTAIRNLTLQFEALTLAQKESMGISVLGAEASLLAGTRGGVKKIPFSHMATGGWVPGTGNYDSQPAMLTPGEFVVNKESARTHSSLLNSINGGSGALGGFVNPGQFNYGRVDSAYTQEIAKAFGFNLASSQQNRQIGSAFGAMLSNDPNLPKSQRFSSLNKLMQPGGSGANASDFIASFEHAGSKTSITSFLNTIKEAAGLTEEQVQKTLENFTKEYKQELLQLGKITDENNPVKKIADKHIAALNNPEANKLYNQFGLAATKFPSEGRGAAGGGSGAVRNVYLKTSSGQKLVVPSSEFKGVKNVSGFAHAESDTLMAEVERVKGSKSGYQITDSAILAAQAEHRRKTNSLLSIGGVSTSSIKEAQAKFANLSEEEKQAVLASRKLANAQVKGFHKGIADAAKMHSPSKVAYEQGVLFAESEINGIQSKVAEAAKAGEQLGSNILGGGKTKGKGLIGSIEKDIESGSKFSKFKDLMSNRFIKSGMIGMAGSMAFGMMPDKIGGVDLSGAKSAGQNIATFASMGSLFGPIGTGVGALAGAVTSLTGWLKASQDKKDKTKSDQINKQAADAQKKAADQHKSATEQFAAAIDVYINNMPKTTGTQVQVLGGKGATATISSPKPITDSYKDLTVAQKLYGDSLTGFLTNVKDGSVVQKDYNAWLKAVASSSGKTAQSANILALAIKKSQDPDLIAYLKTASKGFDFTKGKADDLIKKIVALAGLDWSKINQTTTSLFDPKLDTGPADYSKQFTPIIKRYEAIKKLIQSQADAQKKYNDQLKLTQDYQLKQSDYFNQQKMAFTSGNFLGAAQIKGSAQAAQADYLGTLKESKQQDLLTNITSAIDMIQEGQSSGLTLKQWLSKNKGFQTKPDSKMIQTLLGGVAQNKYTANTSDLISKSLNIVNAGTKAAQSGPYGDINISISADNSVVPDQFAQVVAKAVQDAIKKSVVKNNGTNKVGVAPKTTNPAGTIKNIKVGGHS